MNAFQQNSLVVAIVLLVMLLGIGVWIAKRPLGILIDNRNKMSLSRLQLVLWSWLLISAFFAVAISFKTMNIEMDTEIGALMGISVGAAAGSVIVKGTKAGQVPTAGAMARADAIEQTAATERANAMPPSPDKDTALAEAALATAHPMGVLDVNLSRREASLANLFEGEELTDHPYVDISKVQMFFFTLATVVGYAMILWEFKFKPDAAGVIQFPEISSSLVALLGISHAGYLTVKAAPKTPTA